MRYPASEKLEIINLVEQSHLSVKQTLAKIGVSKSTYYRWYDKYVKYGVDGLADKPSAQKQVWNRIPDNIRDKIIVLALDKSELSPRELAVHFTDTEQYFVSESFVYRLLKSKHLVTSPAHIVIKADNEFKHKTTAINQLWQTDFTYFKVIGWGWMYLSTVLDDYSRYIVSWNLCSTMKSSDAIDTIDMALLGSGCNKTNTKPRILSDNGSSYISSELATWLRDNGIDHTRSKPYHPQTQGKIERWHQSLKNIILLENYYYPEDLQNQIANFVNYYNNQRYHESLQNVTPADVYFGRHKQIIIERRKIKQKTIQKRRLQMQINAI